MTFNTLFTTLWNHYLARTPHANDIKSLFERRGEIINTDHITIHTFNHPKTTIDRLAKLFIDSGFTEQNKYHSKNTRLNAKVYNHFSPKVPKLFISELIIEQMPQHIQTLLFNCLNQLPENISPLELIQSASQWGPIHYHSYQTIANESEYAAWLYAFGVGVNHFTIDMNSLDNFDTLTEVNHFLKHYGYKVHQTGGEIKGSPQACFEQTCILTPAKEVEFADGTHSIPTGVCKFVKRYQENNGATPMKIVDRFSGTVFAEA